MQFLQKASVISLSRNLNHLAYCSSTVLSALTLALWILATGIPCFSDFWFTRFIILCEHVFVKTTIRSGVPSLDEKIGGHLGEYLRLAAVALADVLVAGGHAVVAAYYYYAHCVSFLLAVANQCRTSLLENGSK